MFLPTRVEGWCQQREKIDWQEPLKFNCQLVRSIFIFFVIPRQFSQHIDEWLENQILIPDWTYFHCPTTTQTTQISLANEKSIFEFYPTKIFPVLRSLGAQPNEMLHQ